MPGRHYAYAVTNSHVIREGKSPVIRFNRPDAGTTVLELAADDWIDHPDGDDVAITGPLLLDPRVIKFSLLPLHSFMTDAIVKDEEIGPGDETFMVGRFKEHEGTTRNLPTARFGCISMMPLGPVRNWRGIKQESFLVETRSLGGYSGSPVFVYIPSSSVRPRDRFRMRPQEARPLTADIDDVKVLLHGESGPWLLGIDWGHLPILEPVCEKGGKTQVHEGYVVPSNSGQMAVVPAWRLLDLLNLPEVVEVRRSGEAEFARTKAESSIVSDATD
jgi:hypothetical protein